MRFLADKSALARADNPHVQDRLSILLQNRQIATCAMIDLEMLYSGRNLADYENILRERRSLVSVPLTPAVFDRATEIQHLLARRGQHRLTIPDLIIAAAAESMGFTVLHYDHDYDIISEVAGTQHEWVVPKGSV